MTAPEDRPDERAADWERQADEHYAALVATQSRLADAVEFNRANQARADRAEMHADGLRKSLRSAEARLEAVKAALESSTRRFKLSGLSADGFGIHAAVAAALSVAPQPQPARECGNCGEPYPGRHIIEQHGEHVVICPRHTAIGSTTATHDGLIGACDLCAVHPEAS